MAYAEGRVYYDADSHIMEMTDWLASYADASIRDRLLPIMSEKFKDGIDERMLKVIDQSVAQFEERQADADAAARAEEIIMQTKGWAAIGAFDRAERSRSLDVLGFAAQLVFGTGAYGQYAYSADVDVVYGGATAFNRGIVDFCSDDRRLLPVGHVPFNDAERAVAATREAIELGCKAICFNVGAPADKAPSHPDFDPVYAQLAEADVPFMLHLSVGTTPVGSRSLPPGYRNNGKPKVPFALGGEKMRALDFLTIPHTPELTLGAMILDGVFERHPKLRGGVIEMGAMWVIPWLHWIDAAQQAFQRNEPYLSELSMRPSEYVRRQLKFCPFPGEPVGQMIELAGSELFMFSTDYPHPEGGRDPVSRFEAGLGDTGDAARDQFYASNFAELLGSQLPAAPVTV